MAYIRKSFAFFTIFIALAIIQVASADDQKCGANEEFNNCGTQCQRTCADLNTDKICNHMCAIGCFCIPGYVRQHDSNSACIKETQC